MVQDSLKYTVSQVLLFLFYFFDWVISVIFFIVCILLVHLKTLTRGNKPGGKTTIAYGLGIYRGFCAQSRLRDTYSLVDLRAIDLCNSEFLFETSWPLEKASD